MTTKIIEKEKAIKFRKKGLSYSEILKKVPVAKSTLSLWLRSVGLAKKQKQRLTEKRMAALRRGEEACRQKRLKITELIKNKAIKEIKNLTKRELWYMGTALYWAEGAKEKVEKDYRRSAEVSFSNSDPAMILFYLKWLKEILLIPRHDLTYDFYIHETADFKKVRRYWAKILSIPDRKIRTYFKRHKINTKRRNIRGDYHGLMRIRVKKSTNLNRKITGWIKGIVQKTLRCGVVQRSHARL